jgi:multidrug efflux system membrane fusion protein
MVQDEAHAASGATHNRSTMPSPQKQSPIMRTVIYLVLVGLLVGGGFYVASLLKKDDAKVKKEGVVPVTVATAKSQVIPIEIRSIGNVLPYSMINVVPQVSGQLAKVNFTQGQFVKKSDLLFQIDPSPYQAAVNQAQGNVDKDAALVEQAQANMARDNAAVGQLRANKARDEAQLKFANAEMGRYLTLQKEGVVSKEQKDQIDTNGTAASATIDADQKAIENALAVVRADKAAIETARGTLEADKAARDNAKIQLSWCQIRSPIDGRTSSLAVYQGNVVTANAATTPLVTIAQVKPIYINFTVPEQYLDEVRRNMAAHTLNVDVLVEGIRKNAVLGAVSFLESTVNTQTGTVVMRASFENTDLRLFPGQFVDVIVTMPPEGQTVVVPVTALQTTQQGTAVYTVGQDGTVTFCPVEVERTQKDLAAIGKGIKAGDVVVTDGQLQLVPGAKIKVIKDATVADTRLNSIRGMHDPTSASSTAARNTVSSQKGNKDSANGANLPGNDNSNNDDQNGPVSDVGRAAANGGSVNGSGYSSKQIAPDGANSFAGHHAAAPADKPLQSTATDLNSNDFKNSADARAKATKDRIDAGPGTYKLKGNAQGQ